MNYDPPFTLPPTATPPARIKPSTPTGVWGGMYTRQQVLDIVAERDALWRREIARMEVEVEIAKNQCATWKAKAMENTV